MNFIESIWLIPLFPLFGAAVMLFLGKRLPKAVVSFLCPGTIFVSLVFSVGAVMQLAASPNKVHEVIKYLWLPSLNADWGFLLDPLSSVMILVVTFVGFLIHVYAVGYMSHEGGFTGFSDI
jgi:NADH-quinone oxidoreductase subunit L